MLLWIFITALTLAAIVYVCRPLMRANDEALDGIETEKLLYEARVKELDSEFALGRIDEASFNSAKTEEARKLLKLSNTNSKNQTFIAGKFLSLVTAVFIAGFSLAIYIQTGAPEIAFRQEVQEQVNELTLEEAITLAEKRLMDNPDDLRGWLVVAPVYARQEKFEKAISAYENAIRLSDKDPELTFALGEILVTQANGQVTEEALKYFQKTVQLDEAQGSATFMLGVAAFQRGKNDEAIRIWQAMIDQAEGNEEWVAVVQQRIDNLRNKNANSNVPQPTQDQVESAEQLSNEERKEMINQMVAGLAERLEEDPSDKQSWARLIRSYIVLGRFDDAEKAMDRAQQVFPDDQNLKQFISEARSQMSAANAETTE